ncbi:DMT family transporter [Salaquimonas pukyongi]|uniref:DMT family transporter n=1 Tax=Salaquimonas pukyongi TaxID=2712698 RepID=UPI00096BA0FE|nr:DMT family transporter [Salaquimonas pukyongi]
MTIPNIFLALGLGAIISIYFPMIAQSAKILGSGPLANVPFFGIAFAASIAIALATGNRLGDLKKVPEIPPWLLTAGIMSAGLIIGSSYIIPRIGIGPFFVLLVAGQVLAGMVFGQLGLFGMAASPLTFAKIGGAAMVVGGVYLVTTG